MPAPQVTSFAVLVARLTWMLAGPLALFVLAYHIGTAGTGWVTAANFGYFLILGGMLLARWYEYRSGQGQTAEGGAMTSADLRTYLIGATAVGVGVWVAANVVGNHLLAR